MPPIPRPALRVEALEQRDCPSFTVTLYSGLLSVSGTPTTGPGQGVLFKLTGNNQWQVQDAGHNLGTYNATNVMLSVTQHQNLPITFNLNGFTDTGYLFINLGNGDTSDIAANALAIYGGSLNGNLSVLNGSGRERVWLGFERQTNTSPGLRVGGDVSFNAKSNPSVLIPSGFPDGDVLDTGVNVASGQATPTVLIGGSVNTSAVNAVDVAAGTTVGKNVSITAVRESLDVSDVGPSIYGNVGGYVTITGSQTPSAGSNARDVIFIGDGIDPMTIGGTVTVSTPAISPKPNVIQFTNPVTINGNTSIQTGDGTNELVMDANFNNSLKLQLGNGVNTDTTTDAFPAAFFPADARVGGNFTLTAGNGNNNLTTPGNPFAGEVDGYTSITLGNGANAAFTVSSTALGGQFIWRSGNGNDSLNFTPTTAAFYTVDIRFGNFGGTLQLNDNVMISGTVNNTGGVNDTLVTPPDFGTATAPNSGFVSPWSFR